MSTNETKLQRLWQECATVANDLEEGLWTMFPPDWERLASKLEDLLGEMEDLSPSERQRFMYSLGR